MAADSSEDYYSNNPPARPAPDAKPDETASTALLPTSFFGGKDLTPGTECKVRVEQVMEDQVAVSYVAHREQEDEAPEMDEEMQNYMS